MLIERGTNIGSYRVEGILGRGGMGVVYSASHVSLDRRVALKVLANDLSSSPEFVERFRREGRLQASLDHPHAVTVYEAGESEHGLYLAMQLVRGPTLALLYQERALDAARGLALLRQVGDALDAAHAAGLVTATSSRRTSWSANRRMPTSATSGSSETATPAVSPRPGGCWARSPTSPPR
jgi:serine/threonine protein kinase